MSEICVMLSRGVLHLGNAVSAPSTALSSQLLAGDDSNAIPPTAPNRALPAAASSSSSSSSYKRFHTVGSDVSEGEVVKDVLVIKNGLGEGTQCEYKVACRTELNCTELN
jgi:hypothetical protein